MNKELLEVRYAYRLIWAFQERLLDTIRFLSEQFEGRSFYHYSHPVFGRLPRGATVPFSMSTETFLPLYGASFLFTGAEKDSYLVFKDRWLLEVHIEPDTAYLNALEKSETFTPDGVPPEQTDSIIKLVAWKCKEDLPANSTWLFYVWESLAWPVQEDYRIPETLTQLDGKIVSTAIGRSLAELTTRDEIVAFAREAKLAFKDILED